MRNISFIAVLLIGTACSTETYDKGRAVQDYNTQKTANPLNSVSNTSNPYDHAGKNYLSMLDSYQAVVPEPDTSLEAVELLETIGGNIGFLNADYTAESFQSIIAVQQLSTENLNLVTAQSGLSSQAQTLLLNCITGLLLLKEQDALYDEAYAYLVSFESAVSASALSTEEKGILLSTLSIVRYDFYNTSSRKKKDRDWELSVGNFMATVYGAKKGLPNAIMNAGILSILY